MWTACGTRTWWQAHFSQNKTARGCSCDWLQVPIVSVWYGSIGRSISRDKNSRKNAPHLTPSIKSAIRIIQLWELNPAGLRVPAPTAQRQTQFTDNPYMIALTSLLGSNLFPLLTFPKYRGKCKGNSRVTLFTSAKDNSRKKLNKQGQL